MLTTGQNHPSGEWESQYELEFEAQLGEFMTFMESLEALSPQMSMPPPPGLGYDSDALAFSPQQDLDGTMVDVGKMLGRLERHLSGESQQFLQKFLLRADDKRGDSFFSHDYILSEESKLPPSPGSTVATLSDELAWAVLGEDEDEKSALDSQTYASNDSEENSLISLSTKSPTTSTTPLPLYDKCLLPSEALDALQKLKEMVAEEHLKREDLVTNEVTAQLYPYIPIDDEDNVTSLGTILHASGACKPCMFWKKGRCHKKDLCLYCHCDSEHAISKPGGHVRLSKSKRLRLRSKYNSQQKEQPGDIRQILSL
jgi:hypothetical protein